MRARRAVCALALVIAAAAGCADGALTPTEVLPSAPRVTVYGSGTIQVSSTVSGDTVTDVVTLRVDEGGDVPLGGRHVLHVPGSRICDPVTSSYGPDAWDAPCELATGELTITAVSYRDANGRARVDFSPDLRFAPSRNKSDWVYLTLTDSAAARSRSATILYCDSDEVCVDESGDDPTLRTRRSVKDGLVSRRIKHFSGYLIVAGRTRTAL